MTDLPLHPVSETPTTITLGWTPPPACRGYIFQANGKRSSTLDGTRATVKFAKPGPYTVEALGTLAQGSYPPVAPPPPPGTPAVPAYHVVLTPNREDGRDPGSNYQGCWLDHRSDNGPRTLERSISDEWWTEIQFRYDNTWDTSQQGEWGRTINYHVDWTAAGAEDVTSAQAFDYVAGQLLYHTEPGGNRDYTLASPLPLGVWHTLRAQTILGRTDGSTPRPGSVRAWLNGALKVDTGPTNTIYRWKNGALEQHQWLWVGFYSRAITATLKFDMTLTRFGRSEAEMLADKNWVLTGVRLTDILIPGKPDKGPSSVTRIADRPVTTT